MSKIKRISTILLSVVLTISYLALPTSAAFDSSGDILHPMYTNVNNATISLDKINDKIVITIRVYGLSGTRFSSGEVALLKTSGTNTGLVQSWDRLSSSTTTFIFTDNSTTATSGTYKVNFSIKALRNGVGETISGSDTLTV